MSKRIKVLVSMLMVVVLLAVGGTAMVMAEEEPTPPPEVGAKGLLARVAEILEIPEEDLVNAFKQARQEMRQEAFVRALDRAVEQGRITREEANEIREWCEQKPEVLDRGQFGRAGIFRGVHDRRMMAIPNRAREGVCITQEQADRIRERWQSRPEALDRPILRARIFKAIQSRQQIAVPRGWHRLGRPGLVD